jgi:hypothetical protein
VLAPHVHRAPGRDLDVPRAGGPLVESDIPVGEDTIACLLALLGPNDPVYARAYVRLFSASSSGAGGTGIADAKDLTSVRACIATDPTKCACRSYSFVAPARLTALTRREDVHPALFDLDIEASGGSNKTKGPIRACSEEYGKRLAEARARLWKQSETEDGACWRMLVTASWLGKISSVLAPIE